MLFKKKFKFVIARDGQVRITKFIRGTKRDIEDLIEFYKADAKECIKFGRNGMIVFY